MWQQEQALVSKPQLSAKNKIMFNIILRNTNLHPLLPEREKEQRAQGFHINKRGKREGANISIIVFQNTKESRKGNDLSMHPNLPCK